jgi:hypothetical protein
MNEKAIRGVLEKIARKDPANLAEGQLRDVKRIASRS